MKSEPRERLGGLTIILFHLRNLRILAELTHSNLYCKVIKLVLDSASGATCISVELQAADKDYNVDRA